MALDGITLSAIKSELKDKLLGARIDKIYQPEDNLLTIRLRQPGENIKLLLSANPQNPRVHITEQDFDNPYKPPAFCMLLRKHLSSGRIKKVLQPEFERILKIIIQYKNKDGELEDKHLIVELMGRHSNIILTKNNGHILDCIKRVTKKISRYRELYPGKEYTSPPEQGKANPLSATEEEFYQRLQEDLDSPLYRTIMDNYRGIGPLMGKEISYRAGFEPENKLDSPQQLETLWPIFNNIFTNIQNENYYPTIVYQEDNQLKDFEAFDLKQFDLPKESFNSANQLLDYYFTTKLTNKQMNNLSNRLEQIINNNLEKANKKYNRVAGQLKGAKNADKYQLKGELITANIYRLEKGQKKVKLPNYYEDNKEVTIELDPDLTPAENAQQYFEKYEKAKKRIKPLRREVKKTKQELDYLQQVEISLEQAETIAELKAIEQELMEEDYIQEQTDSTDKQDKKLPPIKFKSSAGYDILVGRNNKQNDKLTQQLANNQDLWIHVKDIAGSHTIIRNHTGKEIPQATIEEAAQIAAFHSKGRSSSNVPVDYTQVKYVNKPTGAKPGMVHYENQTTLYVTPQEEIIKKLKAE